MGMEGKFVVEVDALVDESELVPGVRVALRSDTYALLKILPNKMLF
jgi:26S proteasome regulatory subunit T6